MKSKRMYSILFLKSFQLSALISLKKGRATFSFKISMINFSRNFKEKK